MRVRAIAFGNTLFEPAGALGGTQATIAQAPPPAGGAGRRKVERRLAAILGADIRNYAGMMVQDEEDTHRRVGEELRRVAREIEKYHGVVFSFAGDGLMAEFPSAVEALKCALRIQVDAGRASENLDEAARLRWRVGVNAGEILVQGGRPGGHAINVASRLEQLAEPGGICLSAAVHEQVHRVLALDYRSIGTQRLKHMEEAVAAYTVSKDACLAWRGCPAVPRGAAPLVAPNVVDYRPSLAVLPFRTLQPDQTDRYFAEGIVDDIIRLLGGLKELLVIARSSTLGLASSPLDLRKIGRELDVRYVLHGSVRQAADKIRIAVEFSEAETGHVIWADRFDGELSDLFDLQDRIAMRVLGAVAPNVRERERHRSLRKHPSNMTAYDLTLQALDSLYRMDQASFFRAHDLLAQALSHDPDYAPAYSHTAYWHITRIGQGWSTDLSTDTAAAAQAAQAAVARDRNDALGLAFYGHMQSYLLKNYSSAMEFFDRALSAGPSCAWAHSLSSLTCGYIGDSAKAITRGEHAVRLSPLGADAYFHEHVLSQAHYLAGRYEEAVAWGRMSAGHCSAQTSNLRSLIASLVAAGGLNEAQAVAQRLLQLEPAFRLGNFRSRTPLSGDVRDRFVERLRTAGLSD